MLPLIVLVGLLAALWGGYAWTQTQYYIGVHDGVVAVYQGIPGSVGPIELSTLVEDTDIPVESLEPYARERIEATIRVNDVEEAREVITGLQAGS